VACPVRYGRRYESWKPKPAEGRCATSGTATGQVLAGVSYYMLMICYPVTVGAVVVFMGSWVSFLAGGLLAVLVVVPYFAMHRNAVAIFSDEAGIGPVPILVVYLIVSIALPVWGLATNRPAFRPVKHVLVPLIGSAVLVYGAYQFVQPSQPPPTNVFWAWMLAIVLVAVAATAIVYVRRPAALQRAATAGPEYITQDAR